MKCHDCDCTHENPEPLLSEIAREAIREGGEIEISFHTDGSDRPTGAALVRRLALLGARWSEITNRDGHYWVDCQPTIDERITVYLSPADLEVLQ